MIGKSLLRPFDKTKLTLLSSNRSEQTDPLTLVPETIEIPKKAMPANGVATTNGELDPPEPVAAGSKRKRNMTEAELESENVRKRGKVLEETNPNGSAPILIEDEGAITLD